MKYRLNAPAINRAKRTGKLIDGSGLFYQRNSDGTLTPWQRVRLPGGKDRDVKVTPPHLGEVDADWLMNVRRRAHALKGSGTAASNGSSPLFSDLWARYLQAVTKWSEQTRREYNTRMTRYIAPTRLWSMPISAITVIDIEDSLAEVRKERPLLARRVLLDLRGGFRWALSRGEVTANPAAAFLDGLRHIEKKPQSTKLPAFVTLKELRGVLDDIETSNLYSSLRHALILQAYTVQRTSTIAAARWADIDLKRGQWTIARPELKMKDEERGDLVVALHPTMVAMLKRLPRKSPWVFPSPSNPKQHIDKAHLPRALQRAGYGGRHVPHGWRSALKTLADGAVGKDERPLFAERWIEDVQDHKPVGIRGHYNRARAQAGMAKVLHWWGDQLVGSRS